MPRILWAVPGVRFEPLFQRPHEAFRNAVGAGSMGRNPHMHKAHLLDETGERVVSPNILNTLQNRGKLLLER